MKPIRLSGPAQVQVALRGALETEVVDAIRTIPWTPAELGRLECRKDFACRLPRNGVRYRSKQVRPVFVEAPHEIVVVAVEVCYFREAEAGYVLSTAPARPREGEPGAERVYSWMRQRRPDGRRSRQRGGRKVRAPQGRVLANGQGGRPHGQRHRKQTAARERGKGETVR